MRTLCLVYLVSILCTRLELVQVQVLVSPNEVIAYAPGGSATYLCITSASFHPGAVRSVRWYMNGSPIEDAERVNKQFFSGLGRLDFTNVTLNLDNSRINCAAEFDLGEMENSSTYSQLLVQGLLPAPGSLNITASDSTFSLTWEPPFTLDITGVDPDITGYCVDVIDFSSSVTLHSECEITETEFSYPAPSFSGCTMFAFTITTVNIAGVGNPSTADYGAKRVPDEVDSVLCIGVPSSRSDSEFVYRLVVDELVCTGLLMSLMDVYTEELIPVADVMLDVTVQNITLFTTELQHNRRYSAVVMAENIAGTGMLDAMISSHPIVNATVTTEGGAIRLSTEYFRHSNDSGALYFFLGDVWALVALNREASDHYTLPFRLPAGDYRVFVYDIEPNGTILSGVAYPAYTVDRFTASGAQDQRKTFQTMFSRLDGCTVTTAQRRIDVACTYSSLSGATGFQVIVQRQNQGDKLYVNHTNQMIASVAVGESGMYLVIVLAIEGAAGITGSTTAVEYVESVMVDAQGIAGSSEIVIAVAVVCSIFLMFVFTIAVVTIMVILLVIHRRKYMIGVSVTEPSDGNKSYVHQEGESGNIQLEKLPKEGTDMDRQRRFDLPLLTLYKDGRNECTDTVTDLQSFSAKADDNEPNSFESASSADESRSQEYINEDALVTVVTSFEEDNSLDRGTTECRGVYNH